MASTTTTRFIVKFEGQVPNGLRRWIETHVADKVYEVTASEGFLFERRGGFGYDVGIRPGWCLGRYGDWSHTCIEATAADVISRLRTIRRCTDDAQCRAVWGLK